MGEGIQNLQVVPKVRSTLLFETGVLLSAFDRQAGVKDEGNVSRTRVASIGALLAAVAGERVEARADLGSARMELDGVKCVLPCMTSIE